VVWGIPKWTLLGLGTALAWPKVYWMLRASQGGLVLPSRDPTGVKLSSRVHTLRVWYSPAVRQNVPSGLDNVLDGPSGV
jgi:hypothetical protein